ncbi:MAG: hypothetical protein Q8M45_04600 [Methylotenera sp.]|nr:hypothetical protein [Methylotenera sp.]MDP1754814.1 hypothetical protein [Methylotenera sp.]MDP1959693.1 hypothetical protein [Methylotenera sp.]MDP3207176.1 hypothetical protein [Methylotenera sp.]MDP3942861.1 hypothetical protein [Methylotenera sp.]
MAYILKNAGGEIIAASATENLGEDWLLVENNAKEYLDFLEHSLTEGDAFRESDIHLARVLEDLIALLVARNIIRFTDLPRAAQKRLNERQSMRQKTQLSGLLDETTGII